MGSSHEHHPETGSQQMRAEREGLQRERGPGAGRCSLNAECSIQHLGFAPPVRLTEAPPGSLQRLRRRTHAAVTGTEQLI